MSQRCVMMIQLGARRNYIYAQQLERAGLLHSLATDLAWIEGSDGHFMSLIHRVASRRKVLASHPSAFSPLRFLHWLLC